MGDGLCDAINNYEGCDYDGGDCCESTCVSGDYTCGGGGDYDDENYDDEGYDDENYDDESYDNEGSSGDLPLSPRSL